MTLLEYKNIIYNFTALINMQNTTTPPNDPPPTTHGLEKAKRTISSAHSEPVEIKNRIIPEKADNWYAKETPIQNRKAKQHCCTLL